MYTVRFRKEREIIVYGWWWTKELWHWFRPHFVVASYYHWLVLCKMSYVPSVPSNVYRISHHDLRLVVLPFSCIRRALCLEIQITCTSFSSHQVTRNRLIVTPEKEISKSLFNCLLYIIISPASFASTSRRHCFYTWRNDSLKIISTLVLNDSRARASSGWLVLLFYFFFNYYFYHLLTTSRRAKTHLCDCGSTANDIFTMICTLLYRYLYCVYADAIRVRVAFTESGRKR